MSIDPRALDEILGSLADLVAERLAPRLAGERLAHAPAREGDGWRLLNVAEIAEVLGRSERWVHDAVAKRGLPYRKLDGGGRMFDLQDVRAWTATRRVPRTDA